MKQKEIVSCLLEVGTFEFVTNDYGTVRLRHKENTFYLINPETQIMTVARCLAINGKYTVGTLDDETVCFSIENKRIKDIVLEATLKGIQVFSVEGD